MEEAETDKGRQADVGLVKGEKFIKAASLGSDELLIKAVAASIKRPVSPLSLVQNAPSRYDAYCILSPHTLRNKNSSSRAELQKGYHFIQRALFGREGSSRIVEVLEPFRQVFLVP